MRVITSALLVLVFSTSVQARKSGREVEVRRTEKETLAAVSQGYEALASRVGVNSSVSFKANASQVLEKCTGNCELSATLEDIAFNNGVKRELSPAALKNAAMATSRTRELMEAGGMTAIQAQRAAFAELGLNADEIQRECP